MNSLKRSLSAFTALLAAFGVAFALPVSAATVQPCETTTVVETTDLSTWDFSQTRSAGHYELTDEGLRIYTDTDVTGSPDPRKVAGYYDTNFALANLGNQSIADALDYTAVSGIEPGLQLVVDFDNNGTIDGILVGESVYGENWWLTNSSADFVKAGAPNTGGGNGSNWFGTADEWLTSFPNATVQNIGFSLGSGVNGEGTIESITLGCVAYTFTLPTPMPASKDDCKKGGWQTYGVFKNQGDCVSYVATNGRNVGSRNS